MNDTASQCRVVTQPGVVTAVHGTEADIQIVQTGACASCRIRGVCQPGDVRSRTITVHNRNGLTTGSRVDLHMEERFGWLSVVVAFVVPLILVVGTLFALAPGLGSQELAALVGLGCLIPYYGLLYITRNFFSRIVRFDATPTSTGLSSDLKLIDGPAFHKEGVQ